MKEKILILAKAYPNLSRKYVETVCVAGITDKGEWRRLYPIPYRKLPFNKRFKKFDWIEAETQKNSKEKLKRKESHHVNVGSILIAGAIDPGPNRDWKERNDLLLPLVSPSLELLESLKQEKVSLGLIKPAELIDFTLTPLNECREWEKELIEGSQKTLFGEEYRTPLDRIPWKFSYVFKCNNPDCSGHSLMCEDWELLESWRSWKNKYPLEPVLKAKIREKYFDWMKGRNLHFIIGTESRYNRFLIIGLYYPPK